MIKRNILFTLFFSVLFIEKKYVLVKSTITDVMNVNRNLRCKFTNITTMEQAKTVNSTGRKHLYITSLIYF